MFLFLWTGNRINTDLLHSMNQYKGIKTVQSGPGSGPVHRFSEHLIIIQTNKYHLDIERTSWLLRSPPCSPVNQWTHPKCCMWPDMITLLWSLQYISFYSTLTICMYSGTHALLPFFPIPLLCLMLCHGLNCVFHISGNASFQSSDLSSSFSVCSKVPPEVELWRIRVEEFANKSKKHHLISSGNQQFYSR